MTAKDAKTIADGKQKALLNSAIIYSQNRINEASKEGKHSVEIEDLLKDLSDTSENALRGHFENLGYSVSIYSKRTISWYTTKN